MASGEAGIRGVGMVAGPTKVADDIVDWRDGGPLLVSASRVENSVVFR